MTKKKKSNHSHVLPLHASPVCPIHYLRVPEPVDLGDPGSWLGGTLTGTKE